jgi:hypothetical protein
MDQLSLLSTKYVHIDSAFVIKEDILRCFQCIQAPSLFLESCGNDCHIRQQKMVHLCVIRAPELHLFCTKHLHLSATSQSHVTSAFATNTHQRI